VRDEHCLPFTGPQQPKQPQREAVTVFVMARVRGDRTDSMCARGRRLDAGAVSSVTDDCGRH